MKEQGQYIESVGAAERKERDVQDQLQSQRERHLQQILELQERLREKDRTNDEAIWSLRDQHAKEIQEPLTASGETKIHTIQDLI